jgi:hypothetical protein
LFPYFATGVVDTGGKFAADVVDTGGNLPPVANLTPAANLLPVLLIPVVHLDLEYLRECLKKFETALMGYYGLGGN